jgi:septal ring factor EnvC (AmiA/AmiB activator)
MPAKNIQIIVLLLIGILYAGNVLAQENDQKRLEEKRKELKEEIKKIKTYIDNTQQKEKSLSTQVQDLNQKITTRQKLITTIDAEVDQMSRVINRKSKEINNYQYELILLKRDYADMIYKSYKNRDSDNEILFLFSSQNFYQGYLRFQYLKQYSKYRKNQVILIEEKSKKLTSLIDSLNVKKNSKEKLMVDKKEEQTQMELEKAKQLELVKKYQKQKKEYLAQVKKKQEEERDLTNQIENLINDAIKKSTTTTSTKKGNNVTISKNNEFILAPEDKVLADQFSTNKGILPWPVEKGLVTVRFGKQPDPMDPKLTIESSGVRIATAENQKARSIFNGKVMAVQKNPQNGILSVLIQHGNYISVYANLRSVSVKKGDAIKIKQNIGTIYTDKSTGKTILKFQIWQNNQKLDPSNWINSM